MKIKKLFILLLLFLNVSSCSNKNEGEVFDEPIVFYTDKSAEIDNLSISFNKRNSNYKDNVLDILLNIDNLSKGSVNCKVRNGKVSSFDQCEAESINYVSKFSLSGESNFELIFTIPLSFSKECYYLSFVLNDHLFQLNMFSYPDCFRADKTISYVIDPNIVGQEIVKEGRCSNGFSCDSPNYQKFCDTWYTDKRRLNKFNRFNDKVTNDMYLFGHYENTFTCFKMPLQKFGELAKIHHYSASGVLVLPSFFEGKKLSIRDNLIRSRQLKEVYVPMGIGEIGKGNFVNVGNPTFYYEGSKEEWESLFVNEADIIKTNVVFNTSFAPN